MYHSSGYSLYGRIEKEKKEISKTIEIYPEEMKYLEQLPGDEKVNTKFSELIHMFNCKGKDLDRDIKLYQGMIKDQEQKISKFHPDIDVVDEIKKDLEKATKICQNSCK